MAAANKVTLGPGAEAAEAEVGMEMLFTASLVEAEGRERLLRADGRTIIECRVLGIRKLDWSRKRRLGYNRLLPLMLQVLWSRRQLLKVLRGIRQLL